MRASAKSYGRRGWKQWPIWSNSRRRALRKDGMDADRITGNLPFFATEHFDTRPTKEDGMPDWDFHLHFLVGNVTWDDVEERYKAIKMKPIFEMKEYFNHGFDLRVAAKLVEAGYEIETKLKACDQGGMRYHTWDIKAAPGHEAGWKSANDKNSRRTAEVAQAEQQAVAAIKEKERLAGNEHWQSVPDQLSAVARDKLGGSSRRAKREDLTLADFREYWHARITPEEDRAIAATIELAKQGGNPKPANTVELGMAYANAHVFQRNSVVPWHRLAAVAMERCLAAARPEEFAPEARRQGVLFGRNGKVSMRKVLAQEEKITAFAAGSRGSFTRLNPGTEAGLEGLSAEQKAAVLHVWNSTDQVMLCRGGAGTGKTTMMTPALARIGVPVVLLAPSADASRTTLRREGFKNANTVAAFLGDESMQESVKDGGIIWVDEAGLLAIDDLEQLCDIAKARNSRIVLSGDPLQHKAVDRHGNMLEVLDRYALLPVAKLTVIQRQKGDYAQAVAAIRDRDFEKGDGLLRELGWVVEGQGHDALVAEYARAIEERKPTGELKTVIVVDPTHRDGELLTQELRAVRKDKGLVTGEEKTFPRLEPLGWTDAQKADAGQYAGTEVIQFFRNSGRLQGRGAGAAPPRWCRSWRSSSPAPLPSSRNRRSVSRSATWCGRPATAGMRPKSTASIMAASTASRRLPKTAASCMRTAG